jgi:two-component system, NtrC family, response regulator HydG
VHAEQLVPSSQSTLVEGSEPRAPIEGTTSLALAVAWCREEPWRLGEVLQLPTRPGATVRFGRGAAEPGEPVKMPLGQLRLGRWVPSAPLGGRSISRYQLEVQALDGHAFVRNIGRCPLLVNGAAVEAAEVRPGDLIQLGQQLLFLCVRRTDSPHDVAPASFAFGEPDDHGIVGESAPIWELRRQIAKVAAAGGHVLVTGGTGAGKELVAQAIHALSPRGDRPIVSRNAATIPDTLIDAELFGNARNYPNPGMADRPGLVGEADGSTLFLDEIAELPQHAQSHLLRVLDAGEYQRLGETRRRKCDLRLVAATNRDASALKHDLLARFTFQIGVPSLDARKEDIPLLVRHLQRTTPALASEDVSIELMSNLLRHAFTTGVRELRALLSNALLMPEARAPLPAKPVVLTSVPGGPLTPQQVQASLDEHNGAIEPTWRALGLNNRFALLRLIRRYDLEVRRRPSRARRSRETEP